MGLSWVPWGPLGAMMEAIEQLLDADIPVCASFFFWHVFLCVSVNERRCVRADRSLETSPQFASLSASELQVGARARLSVSESE